MILGKKIREHPWLDPDERVRLFKKHVHGALIRSFGGLIMAGFSIALYVTKCSDFQSTTGAVLSGVLLIFMNIPALSTIKLIKSRLSFEIISFLINLIEIIVYTLLIYFLGGNRSTYLVLLYTAVVSYVGVIAPKRYPYVIALCSSIAYAVMIICVNRGILPDQNVMFGVDKGWLNEGWVIVLVSSFLFSVAVITSYTSGIIKTTRNDLIGKNRELEAKRKELRTYSENLEKSEGKYRRIFESIQTLYMEITLDGIILEVNPAVETVFGVSRNEIIGKSIFKMRYSLPEQIQLMASDVLTHGEIRHYENQFFSASGELLYLSVSARVIRDDYSPNGRVVVDATDVTDRHLAEVALRESEERYRMLIEELKDVVFIVTPEGFIEYTSSASIEFGGYDPQECVGRHVSEFLVDEKDVEHAVELILEILAYKKSHETEFLYNALNKMPFYVEVSGTPILTDGEVSSILCIMRDISHRRHAEEQIRSLTQELMKIQEKERKRIACDLHDDVAQNLASLMISCETFFDNHKGIPIELKHKMSSFSGVLRRSLTFVRDLSYELRPPGLDQLGLIKTLDRYCEDFSEKNMMRVDFYSVGMGAINFDSDTEINLYRLMQEAMNNVKKHADADHVIVRVVASVPDIIIRIQDNGKGFDVDTRMASAIQEKRMGLHSMAERVNFMNGVFRIASKPNLGTTITVTIPGEQFRFTPALLN